MKKLSFYQARNQRSAVLFAFLSQSIWLPLFFVGNYEYQYPRSHRSKTLARSSMDQKSVAPLSPKTFEIVSSSYARPYTENRPKGQEDTGFVLHSALTDQKTEGVKNSRSVIARGDLLALTNPSSFFNANSSLKRFNPDESSNQIPLALSTLRASKNQSSIPQVFTRSDLLGGTLTLDNLNEPLMPAIARAERAQWMRSGDPLAPLPELWREPMRRALSSLTQSSDRSHLRATRDNQPSLNIESARFVHVPSSRILRAREIPLALQPDGSIDILNKPDDPVILEEINRWSVRQRLPQAGRVTAAVVHLHPFVSEPSVRKDPVSLSPESQHLPSPYVLTQSKPAASVGRDVLPPLSLRQPVSKPQFSPVPPPEPPPSPAQLRAPISLEPAGNSEAVSEETPAPPEPES